MRMSRAGESAMSTVETAVSAPANVKLPIYMDDHATTPMDPRVLEAMIPFFTAKLGKAPRPHPFFRRESRAGRRACSRAGSEADWRHRQGNHLYLGRDREQ